MDFSGFYITKYLRPLDLSVNHDVQCWVVKGQHELGRKLAFRENDERNDQKDPEKTLDEALMSCGVTGKPKLSSFNSGTCVL